MEKRIELEKRGQSPSQIEELNLDNCKSTSVVGLSEEWTSLKSLSLINVGLTSLKDFPRLPALTKLELSDNWISGGLEALSSLPKLMYLNLSGNKIADIDTLKPLKCISTLVNLDLFNCDVSEKEGYRQKVFDLIPSLVYLDSFDKDGNEVDEDEDECEEEGNAGHNSSKHSKEDGEDEEDVDDEEDLDDELDDEEDEDDDEDDEDVDEEDLPLDAIYKNYDPEGDGDYEAGEDGEAEEEIEEEELEDEEDETANSAPANNSQGNDGGGRGKKRKHEDEEEQQ